MAKIGTIGTAEALLEGVRTMKDGGARITIDLTSSDADLIKKLIELKLIGDGIVYVAFMSQPNG